MSTALPPHRDPKSEEFVPNSYENRDCVDPNKAHIESPEYEINGGSICYSDSLGGRPYLDPLEATEFLVDASTRPGFHLEYPCRGCEGWKPTELARPRRRGAVEASETCFGCWYGHLDGGHTPFSQYDRDAAFNWHAKTQARKQELSNRLVDSKSEREKERIQKTLDWLEKEEKRALRACHKLRFDPTRAMRPRTSTYRSEPPAAALREYEKATEEMTCRNCTSWTFDEQLTTSPEKPMGYCWDRDGAPTRDNFWCANHRYSPDR